MPRTTRNQEPGAETGSGQTAGASPSAVADREPAGRGARRNPSDAQPAPRPASQDPSDATPRPADPSYDDIARRAYELYQERGGSGGQEVDDWLRAEAELREGRGRRDDEV